MAQEIETQQDQRTLYRTALLQIARYLDRIYTRELSKTEQAIYDIASEALKK
jgi:hypothetical protein